jgi:hypothetical protein
MIIRQAKLAEAKTENLDERVALSLDKSTVEAAARPTGSAPRPTGAKSS